MCKDCTNIETNSLLVQYYGPTLTLCNNQEIKEGDLMTSVISKITDCLDIIKQEINITGITTDNTCLPNIGNTIKSILQALINKDTVFCTQLNNLNTSLTALTNFVNGLPGVKSIHITSCNPDNVSITETSTTKTFNLGPFVPRLTILPYFGRLEHFDNSGKGKSSFGLEGWYIANGAIHNIGGVPIQTINACGRFLKYSCTDCCGSLDGSNIINLVPTNIPTLSSQITADLNLNGTTNSGGIHTHNIVADTDTANQAYTFTPRATITIEDLNCPDTTILGPNPILNGDWVGDPNNKPCNYTTVGNPFTPILNSPGHTHTFSIQSNTTFSANIVNPNVGGVVTPVTINPEHINGIPIQFLGPC